MSINRFTVGGRLNDFFVLFFFWFLIPNITPGELIAAWFCLPAAHWRNQPTTLHSFPWNLIVVGHWRVVCHHRTATVHMVCIAWRRREQVSLRIGWMVTWNHWFRTVGTPVLKEVELSILKKHHVLGPMVRWYLKPTSFGYPISPIFTS